MNHSKTLATVALFAAAILASPKATRAQDLSVDPLSFDCGEVVLGTSVAHSFTFSNFSSSDVSIFRLELTLYDTDALVCDGSLECDFAITSLPVLPTVLAPGEQIVVGVTFTPSTTGYARGSLHVMANDMSPPPGAIAFIPLTGMGVEPDPEPAELMTDLLDFCRDAVDARTLWGVGPGSSARSRLRAFKSQLTAAAFLIDQEADEFTCMVLHAARAKVDGVPRPPDFVAGPATDELVARIDDVRDALDCAPRIRGGFAR